MLNWMVLYGLVVGPWCMFYHHNRVVVPGMESNALAGISRWTIRIWLQGFVIIVGYMDGIPGKGYVEWWETYSVDHSMIVWFLTTVPLTIVLYLLKGITYQVLKSPGGYGWWEKNQPVLHKIKMGIPAMWSVVFWLWLLLTPSLPFFSCFVRMFCLDASLAGVFGIGD